MAAAVEAAAPPPPDVYVLLDLASLEIVKTRKGEFQLMNGDDHRSIIQKHGREPAEVRPDIAHQELMALFDSPLNKAGQLRVFMRTRQNVLIEFHRAVRIPRTYKRFAGLMVQLLHKLKVRAADGRETLIKVVKNPIQRHLPPECPCYGFSVKGERFTPQAFAARLPTDKPVCFVLGAMAAGHVDRNDHENMLEYVSLSQYPLSGATAINRLLGAIECVRGIA
mmetsp:Transcript_11639/g.34659  ORF Transcript_11639/g.34659 Transcript_11639/m.34659 type:complete len:223 (-) Transcript_11639:19-687(-)